MPDWLILVFVILAVFAGVVLVTWFALTLWLIRVFLPELDVRVFGDDVE